MAKYAYGIAASDQQIARQDLNNQTRNRNISDILNGIGVLAQSVGQAHRYAQTQADQAQTASMTAGMLQNPEGMPGAPLQGGEQGPVQPTPWNTVIQRQMAQQARPSSMLEKFGNMFNMDPQGKLDPQAAMGLLQMQGQRASQAATIGLETAKATAATDTAQAAMDQAKNAAMRNTQDAITKTAESYGSAAKMHSDEMKALQVRASNMISPEEWAKKDATAQTLLSIRGQGPGNPAQLQPDIEFHRKAAIFNERQRIQTLQRLGANPQAAPQTQPGKVGAPAPGTLDEYLQSRGVDPNDTEGINSGKYDALIGQWTPPSGG